MSEIEGALAASRKAAEQARRRQSLGRPGKRRGAGQMVAQPDRRARRAILGSSVASPTAALQLSKLPSIVHPLLRIVFRRLLSARSWPKGKTTRAMNPDGDRRRRRRDGRGSWRLTRDTKPRAASSPRAVRRSGRRCSARCRSRTSSGSWRSTSSTTGGSSHESRWGRAASGEVPPHLTGAASRPLGVARRTNIPHPLPPSSRLIVGRHPVPCPARLPPRALDPSSQGDPG